MGSIYEKIINNIITEVEGNYEGDNFELIEQLEDGLNSYNSIHEASKEAKLNYLLSQIIEDCPELYGQQWSSLQQLLEYYQGVIESY